MSNSNSSISAKKRRLNEENRKERTRQNSNNQSPKSRKLVLNKLSFNKDKEEKSDSLNSNNSNDSKEKDEPIDFDEFMKTAQEKMDKVYRLWDDLKNADNSKQKQSEQEFNKIGSKCIDSFGAEIQNKLENISQSFNKNQTKRQQLKQRHEYLPNFDSLRK